MFREGRFFPSSRSDLAIKFNVHWPEMGSWIWHEGPQIVTDSEIFLECQRKFLHMSSKMKQIADCANIVLVLSDTQNNLGSVSEATGCKFAPFTSSVLLELKRAADAYFQRRTELLVVSRNPFPADLEGTPGFWFYKYLDTGLIDPNDFYGDEEQWRQCFTGLGLVTR